MLASYKYFYSILRKDIYFILFALMLCLCIRLDMLIYSDWVIDSDEAIVGLMGKHILEGSEIPVFYYGQHYMGSLEPITSALFFLLFGISNVTLRLVPVFYTLILLPITYLLAFITADRFTARFATLFLCISTPFFIEWSMKPRGGFIEIVVIGTLSFLFCVNAVLRKQLKISDFAIISTLIGVGFWTNNQIIYYIPSILLLFLWKIYSQYNLNEFRHFTTLTLEFIKYFLVSFLFFFLGSLPFWIYNFNNNFASFGIFHFSEDLSDNFFGFIKYSLPIMLGAKRFWQREDSFPFASIILFCIYGYIFIYFIYDLISQLIKNRFKPDLQIIISSSFLIFIFSVITIFITSSFGALYDAPRYLLPIYPILFILLGISIRKNKYWLRYSIACILILSFFLSSYYSKRAICAEPFVKEQDRVMHDHQELYKFFKERNIHLVKTNYWIGYRVAFETKEQVKFIQYDTPFQVRIKSYEEGLTKEEREIVPYLVTEHQFKSLNVALLATDHAFDVEHIGKYYLIYNLKTIHNQKDLTPVDKNSFAIKASDKNDDAKYAVDGDIETRWGTGRPQSAGMEFRFVFNNTQKIKGIKYYLGKWGSDYPRKLSINCIKNDNTTEQIISEEQQKDIYSWLKADRHANYSILFKEMSCKELQFLQSGTTALFDWSISEIQILQ